MGRLIPATGSQISMGRIWNALNLNVGGFPPSAGANIGLNSTLGVNRGNNWSGQGNLTAGSSTVESSSFGGLIGNAYYPYYIYDAYLQVCSGGVGGVCADSGGIVKVWVDLPFDEQLTNGSLYSEGETPTVYRIASARSIIYDDFLPGGTYTFSTPTLRSSGYCCI